MASEAARLVAGEVRAEIARHRLSQEKVAEHLGIHQTSVSRRLAGTYPFNIDELAALAELLEVPLGSLVRAAENTAA